jgi:hypothetical protein
VDYAKEIFALIGGQANGTLEELVEAMHKRRARPQRLLPVLARLPSRSALLDTSSRIPTALKRLASHARRAMIATITSAMARITRRRSGAAIITLAEAPPIPTAISSMWAA